MQMNRHLSHSPFAPTERATSVRDSDAQPPCFISSCSRLSLSLLLALCTACASTSEPSPADPEAKEIKAKDAIDDAEGPEADIFAEAKRLYEARMYSLARNNFQSIKDRFPLGAHANFVEIKIADCYFFNSEYNEAAKFYEGYLKNYPASLDSPYVELQAARAHVNSSSGTGRDRFPLERALVIYDGMVEKYPGTAYGHAAERERASVVQQLADYDLMIIDFYKQRENTAAVEAREKLYQERWATRLAIARREAEIKDTALDEEPAPEAPSVPLSPPPETQDEVDALRGDVPTEE
jgi:outer membrane assembly lipoprotein YfiO